jgi:hypothetical protein
MFFCTAKNEKVLIQLNAKREFKKEMLCDNSQSVIILREISHLPTVEQCKYLVVMMTTKIEIIKINRNQ